MKILWFTTLCPNLVNLQILAISSRAKNMFYSYLFNIIVHNIDILALTYSISFPMPALHPPGAKHNTWAKTTAHT